MLYMKDMNVKTGQSEGISFIGGSRTEEYRNYEFFQTWKISKFLLSGSRNLINRSGME